MQPAQPVTNARSISIVAAYSTFGQAASRDQSTRGGRSPA